MNMEVGLGSNTGQIRLFYVSNVCPKSVSVAKCGVRSVRYLKD